MTELVVIQPPGLTVEESGGLELRVAVTELEVAAVGETVELLVSETNTSLALDALQVQMEVVEPVLEVLAEAMQGPAGRAGIDGRDGAGSAIPVRVYIPASTQADIERLNAAVYRTAKWVLTVTDPFSQRFRSAEVLVMHDGVEAHHVHYAIFGQPVGYAVEAALDGGDMVLRVSNTDTVQLQVDAVRVGHLAI